MARFNNYMMKVAVWDTYVQKVDGSTMHFDIIVPETITEETIYAMGREYLSIKKQDGQPLTAAQCQFCHMEAATPEIEAGITKKGYYILEMDGCE